MFTATGTVERIETREFEGEYGTERGVSFRLTTPGWPARTDGKAQYADGFEAYKEVGEEVVKAGAGANVTVAVEIRNVPRRGDDEAAQDTPRDGTSPHWHKLVVKKVLAVQPAGKASAGVGAQ